ncbi:MAG: glycosyltransferase [Bacteroidaceae bacterium]|nr:glycosyltransferase [Bacteroidaceae bacterium]
MKKHIRIRFVDFWDDFVPENNIFYQLLSEHYDVELSDTPDYLFCSVFGEEHLRYDCVKIFYTGENQCPDFNLYDYAIGFEHLTLGDRYMRLPIYYLNRYQKYFRLMQEKHINPVPEKKGFCSFVYSNDRASAVREQFFNQLSEYKKVSSGGRYRNNIGAPVEDKLAFELEHKFSFSFENSSYPGYCTEKLVQSFAAQTVPIYWGDPTVAETFNKEAFINCLDYSSWDEVLDEVKRIDANPELYERMLKSPALKQAETDSVEAKMSELAAFLCNIVDQPYEQAIRYNRVYWGRRYVKRMQQYAKAYQNSPRGIAERLYMKYFWKHRRKGILWKIDRWIKRHV